MDLLRNREVKTSLLIYIILCGGASILAFLWDAPFGFFILGFSGIIMGVYLITTYKRYQRIRELSFELDNILHGEEHIYLEKYQEGELAVLESEIQKMTLRLREQKEQLLEDKLYLADSIADISHQIRTPLTSINILLSFLEESGITEEKRQKTIREIYRLLSRIDWLITTLLKISKLDAGTIQFKCENMTLESLVTKSVEPLLVPIELRGQELVLKTEGSFTGDLDWTSEALGNVVKNCMEHTPAGGSITIEAKENPIYSEIMVTDTGCGIAKEDLPHIFERFYKGENSSENSFGVGLALARMIVVKQNGTIKAENNGNKGARFIFRFYKELSKEN